MASSKERSKDELRRDPERRSTRHDSSRNDERKDAETSKSGDASFGKSQDGPPQKRQKTEEEVMAIMTRTGGAYIPPARLRMMQAQITDKTGVAYQRMAWEALKKTIHGLINKVNISNISEVVQEIFKENIVRGRGLFARSCIDAQFLSPTFTHVYAALVAIINTKIGELILKRLITNFRRAYRRMQKAACLASTRFIAHLVNQQVADEVIALEIITLLLETPTEDSVEVAIGFLKECGLKLGEVTPKGINAVFDQLRTIMNEGQVETRVQYMIEVIFAVRQDKFKDFPSIIPELDLIEEADQFTHPLSLDDDYNPEDILNVFQFDSDYQINEDKYKTIRQEILGGENGESGSGEDESEDEDNDDEQPTGQTATDSTIIDSTETNLVALRRTIYLTIQSSLDYEECCHKVLRMNLKPGQEVELCHMIVDCCAQQRTYEKFFGLLAQRFCQINQMYVEPFQKIFIDSYDTIHRLETNKLRNVGKFFAHQLFTDAISWLVLSHVKLNEEDTNSASRIFVKILFQEVAEYLGMVKLIERIRDPALQEAFEGIFPRDNPKNTRFAINFFTSIGLGGLTDDLREHLKSAPKPVENPVALPAAAKEDSSSSDSDSSSDSSESSEEEVAPRRRNRSREQERPPVDNRRDNRRSRDRAVKERSPIRSTKSDGRSGDRDHSRDRQQDDRQKPRRSVSRDRKRYNRNRDRS